MLLAGTNLPALETGIPVTGGSSRAELVFKVKRSKAEMS